MGVLADVRSYSVKAGYLPVPGVTVSAAAGWQIATDIGSGAAYRMDYADAQFTWDYSSHVQFYTTANYQTYDIKWQDSGYNELRVASGVRIIPDGQALFTGESVQSLVERLGFARHAHRLAAQRFNRLFLVRAARYEDGHGYEPASGWSWHDAEPGPPAADERQQRGWPADGPALGQFRGRGFAGWTPAELRPVGLLRQLPKRHSYALHVHGHNGLRDCEYRRLQLHAA